MPSRLLREGILDSEAVNRLSFDAEVFYRRLMSVVDDFGRFDGRPVVLRSRLYPLKVDSVRVADISRWTAECVKAGLLALYAVDAKQYILFHKLGTPRAKESKYPPPPDGTERPQNANVNICAQMQTDENDGSQARADAPYSYSGSDSYSGADSGASTFPANAGGVLPDAGGERPRKRRSDADLCPLFVRFWAAYPRKVEKANAYKVWLELKPDEALLGVMLAALAWQREEEQWKREGGKYVVYPERWLKRRRWEDERPALPASVPFQPGGKSSSDIEREMAERAAKVQRLYEEEQARKAG